ncbi:unnamed protein product, partial [Rotaria socialis]
NGFSTANIVEPTGYGGIVHSHSQQAETVPANSRPINHQVLQEKQQQTNGSNVPNQQPVRQTAATQ